MSILRDFKTRFWIEWINHCRMKHEEYADLYQMVYMADVGEAKELRDKLALAKRKMRLYADQESKGTWRLHNLTGDSTLRYYNKKNGKLTMTVRVSKIQVAPNGFVVDVKITKESE